VLAELSGHGLGEVIGSLASGLELSEQGQRLAAQGGLDQWQLVRPAAAEDQLEAFDLGLDIPLASTPHEGGPQLTAGQGSGACRRRGGSQDCARIRAGQA
jgi:hypothetical protein